MATSNNTVWQITRDELITAALRKNGVLAEGEVASTQQINDAVLTLNSVVSSLMTLGMTLWKRVELPITLVSGQATYTIGPGKAIDEPMPLHIHQAVMSVAGSGARYDLEVKPRFDFNNLPSNSSGIPVSVTYQPFIDYGELKVWPVPNSSVPAGSQIYLTYTSPIETVTSGTLSANETLDFPREWSQALIYQLAISLADDYQIPLEDRRWLERRADRTLGEALSNGTEDGSIFFFPDRR